MLPFWGCKLHNFLLISGLVTFNTVHFSIQSGISLVSTPSNVTHNKLQPLRKFSWKHIVRLISYKKAQNLSYRYIIVDVLFIVDFHMLEKEIPAHGIYTTKIFSNIDSSYKSLLTLTQKIYSTFWKDIVQSKIIIKVI